MLIALTRLILDTRLDALIEGLEDFLDFEQVTLHGGVGLGLHDVFPQLGLYFLLLVIEARFVELRLVVFLYALNSLLVIFLRLLTLRLRFADELVHQFLLVFKKAFRGLVSSLYFALTHLQFGDLLLDLPQLSVLKLSDSLHQFLHCLFFDDVRRI